MLTIGIAVAVGAFIIVDIIAVQGLDLTAFNNIRVSSLSTVAIEESGSAAGPNYMKRRREIKQVSDMPSIFIAERMRFSIHFQGRFLPA